MSLTQCPFCEHGNPADAKFCNCCGGTLTLAPCPRCGAVNEVGASSCYQCHGKLGSEDALRLPVPAAAPTPSFRRRPRMIAGAALLAAMVAIGYYASRPTPPDNAAVPVNLQAETKVRTDPSAAAPIVGVKAGNGKAEAPPTGANPPAAITGAGRNPAAQPKPVAAAPAVPPQPVPAAPADARAAQTAKADRSGERTATRPQPCTPAVAALGLCTLSPAQQKDAQAPAPAIITRPATLSADTGSKEPCTEAVAALGLCAPKPTERKE